MRDRGNRVLVHLRAQWAGFLALFLVLTGGVAYAANTIASTDIINNEVYGADVRNDTLPDGGLGHVDLKAGSVRSSEVAAESLTGADVLNASIGSADITDQSVTGDDLAGTGEGIDGFNADQEIIDGTISGFDIGNDQIGGNHIIDGSVTAGDTEDVFDAGYDSDTSCNDDDQDGEVCASTTFTLNQPGVLLVNATGEWANAGSAGNGVEMNCVLQVDGSDIGLEQSFGEVGDNHPSLTHGTMALTALSSQLTAGPHTVQIFCTEVNADIDVKHNQITAARVDL